MYEGGLNSIEISKNLGVGKTSIISILDHYGIKKRPKGYRNNRRTYTLEEDFFDNIDCEAKAYWLGFLSADGHLVENQGITVALSVRDCFHIAKLLDALGSNTPIKHNQKLKSARVDIWSKKMSQSLYQLGFRHDKSVTQTFPEITKEHQRHFIRGLLDGDGSIKRSWRKRDAKFQHTVLFSGTQMTMTRLKDILCAELGVNSVKIQTRNKLFVLEWSGKIQCQRILNWLYQDSVSWLDRKHQRYLEHYA